MHDFRCCTRCSDHRCCFRRLMQWSRHAARICRWWCTYCCTTAKLNHEQSGCACGECNELTCRREMSVWSAVRGWFGADSQTPRQLGTAAVVEDPSYHAAAASAYRRPCTVAAYGSLVPSLVACHHIGPSCEVASYSASTYRGAGRPLHLILNTSNRIKQRSNSTILDRNRLDSPSCLLRLVLGSSSSESERAPVFCRSCSRRSSGGMPSIPNISISIFDRFGNELGTLSMVSLCTCMQCIERPGPVYSFLWHMWHLKCFAFWCCTRIFSSSNSRLQYL